MRKLFLTTVLLCTNFIFAQVGIGTANPATSANLDLTGTSKALLLPRIADTSLITTPVDGMIVYHSTKKCFNGYQNEAWEDFSNCISTITTVTCNTNSYSFTQGVAVNTTILIPYTGGNGVNYSQGAPIGFGNGTLQAVLQAGTAAVSGGNLVYAVTGTPSSPGALILPVSFGGQTCNQNITITAAAVLAHTLDVFPFNDVNNNCIKDAGESDTALPSNIYVKVFDLNNNLKGSGVFASGQISADDLPINANTIYYFIVDDNETASDVTPTLPSGYTSSMELPLLKRYFYTNGSVNYLNTTSVSNLADASWVATDPIRICLSGFLTVSSPNYQGQSVINTTGIGYNAEAVPSTSTITVKLTNTSGAAQSYTLTATDATTGLVYSKSGTIAGNATNFDVVLTPNTVVMPTFSSGVLTMPLIGASNIINLVPRIDIKSIPTSATTLATVTLGTQTWMDRNLGARRKAIAITDVFAYGNYYQWGRPADGHEIVVLNGTTKTSGRGLTNTIITFATTDVPGNSNFILSPLFPYDWRSDANFNRWVTANQGPCPTGYHVPTRAEWETADTFGAWNNNTDAYNSTLKLPSSGQRVVGDGAFFEVGTHGRNWASTIYSDNGNVLNYSSLVSGINNFGRASGNPVRCLKN